MSSRSEKSLISFALDLLNDRRIESAIRVIRFLQSQKSLGEIDLDNDEISISVLLARCLAASGDFTSAINELEMAIRRDPDTTSLETKGAIPMLKGLRAVNAAKEAANEIYKKGDAKGAADAYYAAQALAVERIGEPFSLLHSNAAAALITSEKFVEAADQCKAALSLHPTNVKAWMRLGTCLLSIKNPDGHAESIQACLAVYQALSSDDSGASKLVKQVRSKYLSEEDKTTFHHPNNDKEVNTLLSASRVLTDEAKNLTSLIPLWTLSDKRVPIPSSPRLVIVDVFATWCGPCKQIGPHFDNTAQGNACVTFLKIDGDKNKGFCSTGGSEGKSTQAAQCSNNECGSNGCGSGSSGGSSSAVRAFPTFISFLDGKEINRMEGAELSKLNELIKDSITLWRRTPPSISGKASKVVQEASLTADGRADISQLLAHALFLANIKKFEH